MKLTSVAANRHVFDDRPNGKPLRFLLGFDDGRTLRLAVAGDGYRMQVDTLPLDDSFDMGEYGKVEVEDMTQSLDRRLEAAEVVDVRLLKLDGNRVGVQLLLAGGDAFHFWVDGDELRWGDESALNAHHWLDGRAPAPAERVQV